MEGLISSASWPYRVVSICNHYLAVAFVDGVLVRLLNIDFCYTDSARIVVFFLYLSDADRLVAVSACWPYSVVADTRRLVTRWEGLIVSRTCIFLLAFGHALRSSDTPHLRNISCHGNPLRLRSAVAARLLPS